ncbi:hypothetical protein AAVH_43086 [Aphelenchoides avenae]|nr:hypothetical protein AAVH_43086 [Aphelenchus avenae]
MSAYKRRKTESIQGEHQAEDVDMDSEIDEELKDASLEKLADLLSKTRKEQCRMRKEVARSSKTSAAAFHAVAMLNDRVEKLERYSRKMNLLIKGYVRNPSYNDPNIREEKALLISLLKGLKLSAQQVTSVTSAIVNIHWMDSRAAKNADSNTFIVRFGRQESLDLINANLPKLKDYKIQLGGGRTNYVRVDPDLTKVQRDEQNELVRARAILKEQKRDCSNVRLHKTKGFYVVLDGEKLFKGNPIIAEALKNSKKKNSNE